MSFSKLVAAGFVSLSMAALPAMGHAVTLHVEAVDGDLGTGGAETLLGTLVAGVYDIFGSMQDLDKDYFSFEVASGFQLESIVLQQWDTITSGNFLVRIVDQASVPTFTNEFELGNASNIGLDLILLAGLGPFGSGDFSSGTRTGFGIVSYQFQITVAAIPLPAALPLGLAGLGMLGLVGWRRRRITA